MVEPSKKIICQLHSCSLERAISLAQAYGERIWGFSIYDLVLMEGLNAVYVLKKYTKVLADLRLDNPDIDYILQCAWAAGADLVSIKRDSAKFTANIVAYPTCSKSYSHRIIDNQVVSKEMALILIPVNELIL